MSADSPLNETLDTRDPGVADRGRDLRHDAARRLAARGHLADRRRQAAHRRAARLARRALHRGRLAGREPEGRRVVPAQRHASCTLDTSTLVAFGSTRRPKGKVDSDDTLRHLRRGGHRRPCASSASAGTTTCSRRSRPRSTKASRWSPTRSSTSSARARRCSSTPSTSSTATGAIPSSACACSRARPLAGADRLVLCDTNGGTLPHEVEAASCARSSTTSARRRDRGPPPRRRRAPASRTRSPACSAARSRCRARSTATASAPATATSPRSSPNLTLKMGIETIPRDRLERLTPVAHHVAELVNMALNPQAPYVGASAFAHKAGLHVSAIAKRPDAYEHVPPDSRRQRHPLRDVGARRAESTLALKAKELGLDARRPAAQRGRRHAEAARARGLPLRGGRRVARAADAPRDRAGSSRGSAVESFRVIADDLDADATPGGVDTEATIKVHVGGERDRRDRRGQRAGERARRARCARRVGDALPGARPRAPHRLQGAGPRHRRRAPARSPACWSTPPTATARGRRSASARTSSRRRGRRCSTRSSTACSSAEQRRRQHIAACRPIPYVPDRPRRRARARSPTSRRASSCRRAGAGGPTVRVTSSRASPSGALLGSPGPERRLRAHAGRARDATDFVARPARAASTTPMARGGRAGDEAGGVVRAGAGGGRRRRRAARCSATWATSRPSSSNGGCSACTTRTTTTRAARARSTRCPTQCCGCTPAGRGTGAPRRSAGRASAAAARRPSRA